MLGARMVLRRVPDIRTGVAMGAALIAACSLPIPRLEKGARILLFAAIWRHFFPEISIADIEDSTPRAIAVMTVSLAFIYLLGLLCHGFQRAIWELLFRRDSTSVTKKSWFDGLDRTAREELALYFWYCAPSAGTSRSLSFRRPSFFLRVFPVFY